MVGDETDAMPVIVDEVDQRLRTLGRLSAAGLPPRRDVDMSPAAVTARLDECAQISALALALMAAGEAAGMGAAEEPEPT